jgi:hypothetical protein
MGISELRCPQMGIRPEPAPGEEAHVDATRPWHGRLVRHQQALDSLQKVLELHFHAVSIPYLIRFRANLLSRSQIVPRSCSYSSDGVVNCGSRRGKAGDRKKASGIVP